MQWSNMETAHDERSKEDRFLGHSGEFMDNQMQHIVHNADGLLAPLCNSTAGLIRIIDLMG